MSVSKRIPRIRKILIALNLATESGRDIAAGIFGYARANCHWQIDLLPIASGITTGAEINARAAGFDGVIYYPLGGAEPPVAGVAVGFPEDTVRGSHAHVRIDDEAIGAFAVRYLTSLGNFSSFVYVPERGRAYYSLLREKGFRNALRAKGLQARYRRAPGKGLSGWLKGLPKPAAILACADSLAVETLAACHLAGVAVPQQAVVLGVDDDKLLCDFSDPPLTSLRPDHERVGFLAAEQLDRLIENRRGTRGSTKVGGVSVSERESTRPPAPSGPLLSRALRFIRYHLHQPITAVDVAVHLGVSRRLADLRFREQTGETLTGTILRLRLEEVAARLTATAAPVKAVAAGCGFANANHLSNAFRRHFGMSMTAYRRSQPVR